MLKRPKRRSGKAAPPANGAGDREAVQRALKRANRVEKDIQKLTRRLEREMQRTNDRLQALATALSSRARALEGEREAARALNG